MSLPVITTPKFTLVLPSSGHKLKYRPFIVREQKLLLSAIEMQDPDQLNNAVEDIIKACTFGEFDIDNAPVYDVEWVLLQIRAKSAGEVVDMTYKCNNLVTDENDNALAPPVADHVCGSKIPVPIKLMDVRVDIPESHVKKIMITDTIGVQMRDLPYGTFKMATKKSAAEAGMDVIAACINKVFDADQVYSRKDFTNEELGIFLENLSNTQFAKFEEFMESMPVLKMTLDITCPKCGNRDTIELIGLDDFLS